MASKVWMAAVVVVAIVAWFAGYYSRAPAAQTTTVVTTYSETATTTYSTTVTTTYLTTVTTTATVVVRYYPITVVDALNRTLQIAAEPARVVSLAPSITQMLVALGLCSRIVGLDQFSYQLLKELNYTSCLPADAEVVEINAMSPTGFNGDAIILLKPDLVLADSGIEAMWAKDMQKLGVPVYFLYGTRAASFADIERDVEALGKIFDRARRAAAVVGWMETELAKYRTPTNATVAQIVWINPDGSFYAAGNNTFVAAEIRAAGGINAIGQGGWGPFEPSLLIAANPSVIVVGSMGFNCTYALQTLRNIPPRVERLGVQQRKDVRVVGPCRGCGGPAVSDVGLRRRDVQHGDDGEGAPLSRHEVVPATVPQPNTDGMSGRNLVLFP
jgi:ABC-type Fe3+-hydroxamate transport system, periplasmic component